MDREEQIQQLITLFEETKRAHLHAYAATDGADPDWPIWYAEYMHEKFAGLLNARLTRSELVYLLVLADKEMALHAPGALWTHYYAGFFIERYSGSI